MSRLCTLHVQSVQSYLRPRSASGMGQINFMFNGCRELKKKIKSFLIIYLIIFHRKIINLIIYFDWAYLC